MTKKIKTIVYGLGGYDIDKPDNNVVEVVYCTKEEEAEIANVEAQAMAKADLLAKLGITADEAKLLLG